MSADNDPGKAPMDRRCKRFRGWWKMKSEATKQRQLHALREFALAEVVEPIEIDAFADILPRDEWRQS